MTWEKNIIWCSGCGIEITWGAFIKQGRAYCCEDCSNGNPCMCAETVELDTDIRKTPLPLGG